MCSTRNQDIVGLIGADKVIDYTQDDFTQSVLRHGLIVGGIGYRSIFGCKRALSPTGIYFMTGSAMA